MTETEPVTTLNVRFTDNGDGTARYVYDLRASDATATGPLQEEHTVEVNATLVRNICARLDAVLTSAADAGAEHRAELTKYGQSLYDQMFPLVRGNVPGLVTKLAESSGPLLVRSNETEVPWELLHDGQEFLGLTRPMGRSSVVRRPFVTGRAGGSLKRALIVADPLGDLDRARREAEQVAQWLTDRGTQCTTLVGEQATLEDVVLELQSNPYDLFHYCGHVALAHDSAETGLVLHRRSLLDDSALGGLARRGAPPVVFINGCGSAAPIANLCVSFMVMGAKTVVGTRADVAEDSALRFAEEFYRRLLGDEPAGTAMREARAALVGAPDPAWASFLLYGDPSVRVGEAAPAVAPAEVPHRPEQDGYPFTPEAEALMARAWVTGRRRGVITSMDLLLALITAEELRGALADAVGAVPLSKLTELLYTMLQDARGRESGGEDAPDEERMKLSDTVVDVMIQAETRAAAEGRSAITSRDVSAAFVQVGGGSSAVLLELCDIPLRKLVPADAGIEGAPPGESELFGNLFNGDSRIRVDRLDRDAAQAVRAARLLAKAGGQQIGTYVLLQGFAVAGSRVLRQALAAQGEAGERALQALTSRVDPRRGHFSPHTLAALERAAGAEPGPILGEVEILRELIGERGSSVRALLRQLGIDPDALSRELRRPD